MYVHQWFKVCACLLSTSVKTYSGLALLGLGWFLVLVLIIIGSSLGSTATLDEFDQSIFVQCRKTQSLDFLQSAKARLAIRGIPC